MRKFVSGVALAAGAFVGVAHADEGDKFVIQGDAATQILEQNAINVDTAEKIGKTCVSLAQKQGVKVSVVIYDQFGELVYFYRMDGQPKGGVDTAILKAKTVLNTRRPSKAAAIAVAQGRSSALLQYSFGNLPSGGALPIIINNKQFIGAIGVGGSAPNLPAWSDEICAWKALTAVMGPQPALLPDPPRDTAPANAAPAPGR